MFTANDAMELENGETTPEESAKLLQKAINDGTGWLLQGSYGRSMMQALEAGDCMLGLNPAKDAFGNRIPARHEVEAGSKGSRALVVQRHGEAWAQMLESVEEVHEVASAAPKTGPRP